MKEKPKLSVAILPWTKEHDASQFISNLASISRYIQEQAHRDVSSYTSSFFVLTEPGNTVLRGYYSLSSISIVFNELPENIQSLLGWNYQMKNQELPNSAPGNRQFVAPQYTEVTEQ